MTFSGHNANLQEHMSANNAQMNAQNKFLSYSGGLVSAPLQPTRPMPYSPQPTASGLGLGYATVNNYQKGRLYFSNPTQSGALTQNSQNNNYYANGFGGYKGFQSQKDAEALAMAKASSLGLYEPSIINPYPNGNMYSLGNTDNRAEFLSQSKNSIYFPNSNSYQFNHLNTAQPGVMQVMPTPDLYPGTYSRPGYNPTPLHVGSNWDTSKATANSSECWCLFVKYLNIPNKTVIFNRDQKRILSSNAFFCVYYYSGFRELISMAILLSERGYLRSGPI